MSLEQEEGPSFLHGKRWGGRDGDGDGDVLAARPSTPVLSPTDSHGHMDPSLRPLWELAFLGSSFVMWEQTTQATRYALAQLSGVQQWVSPGPDPARGEAPHCGNGCPWHGSSGGPPLLCHPLAQHRPL